MVSGRFLPRLLACRCANRPNSTNFVLVGSRVRPNLPNLLRRASCTRRASERYHLIEGRQSVMGAQPCPSAERAWQEVLLVDGGENLGRAALERPVRNSRNAERALFLLAGLRDIDASDVWRSIS